MNAYNLFIIISSITVAILSVILNFTGRQKYKDNAAFFESANHEVREQNTTLRADNASLQNQLVKAQAESDQKDKTIEQLKPFSEVITIMSNNHKIVMQALAEVTKKVTEKVDGQLRQPTRKTH